MYGSPTIDRARGAARPDLARRTQTLAATVAVTLLVASLLGLGAVALVHTSGGELPSLLALAGVALASAIVVALVLRAMARLADDLAEREATARELADQDPLTGLGNYRLFWRQTASEAARVRRHGGAFSLALLDLDNFKAINDDLGHRAGDETLQLVAVALREVIRTEDLLCRHGGDEFAVIAVEAGPEQAAHLSDRLVEAVGRVGAATSGRHAVTATAGWATFGVEADNVEDLVLRADEKLRAAKRASQQTPRAQREGAASARRDAGEERITATPATVPADRREPSEPTPDVELPQLPEALEPEPAPPAPPPTSPAPPAGGGELLPPAHLQREDESRLRFLGGLARALAAARNERAAVETAVAHLAGAVDAVLVAVLRVDRDSNQLDLIAFAGPHAAAPRRSQPADVGVTGAAVKRLQAELANDVREDPRYSPGEDMPDVGSELAVPVIARGEVWGVIDVVSDRTHAYGDDDVALVEAVAIQLGRALTTVWAFQQLLNGVGSAYRVAAAVQAPGDDSWRVADLAWRVGRELGLPREALEGLYLAALFHDVGTVGIPTDLLVKPGRLTGHEMELMREHTIIGERLLRPLPRLRGAARIVRNEHERYDGRGYPDGLAAEDIPLASRVLFACDAFVAMTSARPFRPALTREQAMSELRRVAGTQLDPFVVDTLLDVLQRSPGGG